VLRLEQEGVGFVAVTIKDIAEVAGVSHTTVSRALRGNPRISAVTIRRIQLIAEELGYVPNNVARGLKTSRSQVLGVIVRRIVDPFFSEVLQGIEDVLHEAGYSLFLAASLQDPEREREIIQAMGERRVDGVIACSTQIWPGNLRHLDRFRVPLVLINNQSIDEPNIQSVYHDDAYGSRQLMQHLLGLGHTSIACIGNARGGRTNAERIQGYQEALVQAGLDLDPNYVAIGTNGQPDGGVQGMKALLTLAERPTAVVCYNDMMAIGAIQAVQQAGLHVPDDVSITGFDNIELAAYVTPPLTTFHQPKYELGREAAIMMLRVLTDKVAIIRSTPEVVMLRGELTVRDSTAPPRVGIKATIKAGEE
jgi:DNA-binding LacI/PurR family transcriptional regulator